MKLRRVWQSLLQSWWLVPALCTLFAVGLSFGVGFIDQRIAKSYTAWYLFGGGPEGARNVLSVIAQSVLTFSGLVFSVTILVLQLASSQFSPRVLKTFLRDRPSQLSLGTFVGTFVYALVGLRSVRGTGGSAHSYVPSFTVWLAVALAVGCVGTFIFYIDHIAQSIRAVVVIRRIGKEMRQAIERLYPEGIADGANGEDPTAQLPFGDPALEILYSGTPGVLQEVDGDDLLCRAVAANVRIAVTRQVGEFVVPRSSLAQVWGDPEKLDLKPILGAFAIGKERTLAQDPAFGMRQLVDIAERALSPGINDPSTAVQALDELHAALSQLAGRRFPARARSDADGSARLVLPRPDFADYLHLAIDEIAHYGQGAIQIDRRLTAMLKDLQRVAPIGRRPVIEAGLASLDARYR